MTNSRPLNNFTKFLRSCLGQNALLHPCQNGGCMSVPAPLVPRCLKKMLAVRCLQSTLLMIYVRSGTPQMAIVCRPSAIHLVIYFVTNALM